MHIVEFTNGFANQLFMLCLYEKLRSTYGPDAVRAERSFFGTLGYLAAAVLLIYALGLAAGRLYEAAAGPIWKKICQRVTFPEIRV